MKGSNLPPGVTDTMIENQFCAPDVEEVVPEGGWDKFFADQEEYEENLTEPETEI